MEVKQIYSIVNSVTSEVLGKTDLVLEDLSNIVDVGTEVFNGTSVDNYVKSLVNHIGKVVFVDRPYSGNIPSLVMDSWEYGSVLEKISADLPQASENDTWDLQDGQEYKQDIFYKPSISAKFFNNKVTFEIPMSFTERQVKESFSNASQLNGFISMIYNAVDKSMTVKMDGLIMRTINNMIGETVVAEFGESPTLATKTGMKAVNLLKLYNEKFGKTLTAVNAITDGEFIRFASYMMTLYIDRLSKISTLFNVGGKDRFTSKDMLNIVMLSEFKSSATAYLQSDTFHDNYVALPNSETVPYWQGSGQDYSFTNTGKINVKTSTGKTIEVGGVLAVMFDKDSMGVCNLDKRVTTNYNAKAEFFNNYYKFEAGYFNDLNENFVVFFVA
jgi:hypothetical protein